MIGIKLENRPKRSNYYAALQIDHDFVEAHFNAAQALHQMDWHEEATRHFGRTGELTPGHEAMVNPGSI